MEISILKKAFRGFLLFLVIVSGLFTIIATSGDSGDSTVEVVEPEPNTGITIVVPSDGSVFVEGDYISFVSRISEPSDTETYTYSWESSKDGPLGTTANLNLNTLTAGEHVVVLTLTDADGNTVANDSVTITMGESDTADENTFPVAAITAPKGDMSFNVGEVVTFTGTGTDTEDGELTDSSLVWSSDQDGGLGTGGTITVDTLSQGEHIITLTVTDSKSSSTSAFIIVTVGSASSSPSVVISSPVDSTTDDGTAFSINAGDTINFTGSAMDFDGTPITGENLEWISSKDGKLFTGNTFELNTRSVAMLDFDPLKEGEHTIYLRATGSSGTGQASITIDLVNTNPEAFISNPCDTTADDLVSPCATFAPGEWINLQGTATDAEDGNLSGSAMEWTSHIDGFLGTGESLNIKTDNVYALGNAPMSDGEHIITLEAKDEWGASGIASIVINIGTNTEPVASITYPSQDELDDLTETLTAGGTSLYVTFYGEALDAEDGPITSNNLEWYRSDQQGKLTPTEPSGADKLTSSVRVDLSTFAAGTHTISLVATDSMGTADVETRSFEVAEAQ